MANLNADDEIVKADPLVSFHLFSSYTFWHQHRLTFNIIVGIAGFVPTLLFFNSVTLFDVLGIVLWGLVANVFYSVGYSIESFFITKTKGKTTFIKYRSFLFWLGTVSYALVSIYYAFAYFLYNPFL